MAHSNVAPAAQPAIQPAKNERRSVPRFPCLRECLVRPENASGAGDWHAIAYNVSATGIGVGLPYQVDPGTILVIQPWCRSNLHVVRARVVRSQLINFLWFHGCELTEPLGSEELQKWLD
jgi:hypothetical protein